MGAWSFKIDIASGGRIILFNIMYLVFLTLVPFPYYVTIQFGQNTFLTNNLYAYFQYGEAIICVFGAMWIFEETFKQKTYEFILTFPVHKFQIILARFFRFAVCFYIPLCAGLAVASRKLNDNIIAYCVQKNMPLSVMPTISPFPLIFQSLVVINFFVILSLFLLKSSPVRCAESVM